MGTSRGDFIKYPRTPHLFGSSGTDDDKHLSERESAAFINDASLIVEEKIDGTNVGIHFADDKLILQCRGHLITEGMHAQYDLFKRWCHVKQSVLRQRLDQRYILFGEWLYARHSVGYQKLPHYFFEFDIYDKQDERSLTYVDRMRLLEGTNIQTVPVLHRGKIKQSDLKKLIGPSRFDSRFENPINQRTDSLMEGLYLRTENAIQVTGRAKLVRPEFIERLKQSSHWQHQALVPNQLAPEADFWG